MSIMVASVRVAGVTWDRCESQEPINRFEEVSRFHGMGGTHAPREKTAAPESLSTPAATVQDGVLAELAPNIFHYYARQITPRRCVNGDVNITYMVQVSQLLVVECAHQTTHESHSQPFLHFHAVCS
ncbi:uncharacterized protein LAJ45_02795 [Morchella importuna]|uniref:uncharacterized protein n=1 Tax=Morchella importuna TaxID=1174673 RepID=UPI001E8D467C|nr:uncharacterized protein LAJ45_02795 [Morchella importuna]KAH8153208.1 hypothetical protein LAJ45_02795 [Morchella importuna]